MDTTHDTERTSSEQLATGRQKAVNWILAILTGPGACAVVAYSYLQVLGSAGCSGGPCKTGPGQTVFGLIEYGIPIVAAVAIVVSFVTARRRHGIVVPAVAWLLIIAAAVVLFATF